MEPSDATIGMVVVCAGAAQHAPVGPPQPERHGAVQIIDELIVHVHLHVSEGEWSCCAERQGMSTGNNARSQPRQGQKGS